MNFDFSLILLVLIIVTGVIWLIDTLFFRAARLELADKNQEVAADDTTEAKAVTSEPILVEYARFLFPVVLIVFVLRGFLVEPFRIPSGSMLPTLEIGDFILVNKFAYGLRVPVLNKKILELADPERGDIVVFRYPRNPSVDYIKRVVGLPGDKISYYNKIVYINGEPMRQEFSGSYDSGRGRALDDLFEQLGSVKHRILRDPSRPTFENSWVIPEGKYFVMGDNRDNSNDSRVWGFVPDENLVGKAFFIWMNWDSGPSWGRIGTVLE